MQSIKIFCLACANYIQCSHSAHKRREMHESVRERMKELKRDSILLQLTQPIFHQGSTLCSGEGDMGIIVRLDSFCALVFITHICTACHDQWPFELLIVI